MAIVSSRAVGRDDFTQETVRLTAKREHLCRDRQRLIGGGAVIVDEHESLGNRSV
jgi:hypothetical protein